MPDDLFDGEDLDGTQEGEPAEEKRHDGLWSRFVDADGAPSTSTVDGEQDALVKSSTYPQSQAAKLSRAAHDIAMGWDETPETDVVDDDVDEVPNRASVTQSPTSDSRTGDAITSVEQDALGVTFDGGRAEFRQQKRKK